MRGKNLILGLVLVFSLLFVSGNVLGICTIEDSCAPENTVIELSDVTNAHAAYTSANPYSKFVCCDFSDSDSTYLNGYGVTRCDGRNNQILELSETRNAHAGVPENNNYGQPVCFKNLECRSTTDITSQAADEFELISLSSPENAHLGAFNVYPVKIYCRYNGCSQFDNKVECDAFTLLPNGVNCSWTPPGPTKTSNPEGGCCGENEQWDDDEEECIAQTATLCDAPGFNFWSPLNVKPGLNVVKAILGLDPNLPYNYYCYQVTKNSEQGFWYPVKTY